MKIYHFTKDEQMILREALREYKYFISPARDASPNRVAIYRQTAALLEQFINDIRMSS